MRHRFLLFLSVLVLSSEACGPIEFISQVTVRAERAVNDAKLMHARRWAPYEYWGAVAYLEQAKYRAGYGDFQTSYRYGKKAEKMATEAARLTKIRVDEDRDVNRAKSRSRARPRSGRRDVP